MPVNDYTYLPRSFIASYQNEQMERADPLPFTPLRLPITATRVALVTTAGIWNRASDPPFDYEREQREPLWGDPSFRVLPNDLRQEQVGAGHLHLNNDDMLADFNTVLPVARLNELVAAGEVGSAAARHFSFMGWQGRVASGRPTETWERESVPAAARLMREDGVDAAVIAPT